MFAIYVHNLNRYMCKDHNKIILFDDFNKANAFAQAFFGYAMSEGFQEALAGNPGFIMEIQNTLNSVEIKEFTETDKETVNFNDLKRR